MVFGDLGFIFLLGSGWSVYSFVIIFFVLKGFEVVFLYCLKKGGVFMCKLVS